jgi:hypothetical protein
MRILPLTLNNFIFLLDFYEISISVVQKSTETCQFQVGKDLDRFLLIQTCQFQVGNLRQIFYSKPEIDSMSSE